MKTDALSSLKDLTDTEKNIAKLATQGLNNKEIANSLFISIHTVKAHLTNIYRKTNTKNRTQLSYKLLRYE